jgi:hypothetical protein
MTIEQIASGEIQCSFCGNRVVVEWWNERHQKEDREYCNHWPDNPEICLFVAAWRWFGWDLASNTFRQQFGVDRANMLGREDVDWLCARCIAETIQYPLQ